MKKSSGYQIVKKFFEAQFDVFDRINIILEQSRYNIEKTPDVNERAVSSAMLKDLIKFESNFGEFDVELWNYVYDVSDSRELTNQKSIQGGFSDHKEYFFNKIESCVNLLQDVITETSAVGYEWNEVDSLLNSVENLFDACEELIEIDPRDLDDPEVVELFGDIPLQKLAPIEVVASSSLIKRKIPSLAEGRMARSSAQRALVTLSEVISDINDDIQNSNCDIRIKKCSKRMLREISNNYDDFHPISFGINVSIFRSFSSSISEEFGEASAAYILAALVQSEAFLRNFQSWIEYSQNSLVEGVGDSGDLIFVFSKMMDHEVFDADVKVAAKELEADKRETGIAEKKFEYSIFQSVSNVISTALREALLYVAGVVGKTARYIAASVERAVGVLAVSWLTYNYFSLLQIAEKYEFFKWIKPVIEFVKKYSATQ
ncbi:hypothetical protein FJ414_10195 [Mesorhizobium sp. B3-1-6]|uniref:hypothetical protein n=1 Tax=Mesorhizobium sp. B3-1-6 TaxID=2589895 RepID=UPI00112EA70C|nr:hypothetical protein [Mesorhizobium sp. B3-1-6]TPI39449.1 hypothetical protein FJ414_10195 [Mesorhizobium sp. B3-1-6]